jgi:hypothetical protein
LIKRCVRGSSIVTENDDDDPKDDDTEEEEEVFPNDTTQSTRDLEKIDQKTMDVETIEIKVNKNQIILRPFYQRGFKWTQAQASLYLESILYGFPCTPPIIFLSTKNDEHDEDLAVFDGQQRLTSIMYFIKNIYSESWTKAKNKAKNDDDRSFRLMKLKMLNQFNGMRFQDLTRKQQKKIMNFDINCVIIPSSWSMENYM